jgi:K+ transporter
MLASFHKYHSYIKNILIKSLAGMAVISGMLVTTCLMSLVIALYWEKSWFLSAGFLIFFGFVETTYLSASMLNFHKGAWYLVVLLALSLTVMLAWHYGTIKKYEFDLQNKVPTEWLTEHSSDLGVSRIPGIGLIPGFLLAFHYESSCISSGAYFCFLQVSTDALCPLK